MSTLVSERRQPIIAAKLLDRVPGPRSTPQTSTPRAPATREPAAVVVAPAVVTPRASWSLILDSIVATLRVWRRRSAARRELASLDERMIRDIGLDRGTVDYEASHVLATPSRLAKLIRRSGKANGCHRARGTA